MNNRRSESLTGGSSSGHLKRHEFFFIQNMHVDHIFFGLDLHSIFLAWHSRFYLNYMTFMCITIYHAMHKRYMYHDQII